VVHKLPAGQVTPNLCNLENGKADASLNTLRRLAKVLEVRVADLVADE